MVQERRLQHAGPLKATEISPVTRTLSEATVNSTGRERTYAIGAVGIVNENCIGGWPPGPTIWPCELFNRSRSAPINQTVHVEYDCSKNVTRTTISAISIWGRKPLISLSAAEAWWALKDLNLRPTDYECHQTLSMVYDVVAFRPSETSFCPPRPCQETKTIFVGCQCGCQAVTAILTWQDRSYREAIRLSS